MSCDKDCKVCGQTSSLKKECEGCHTVLCVECIVLHDDKCVECNKPISSGLTLLPTQEEEEIIIPPPIHKETISDLTVGESKKTEDVFQDSKIRLPNIGNSCYVNSALQICLHSKRLWKECCEIIGESYLINFLMAVTTVRQKYAEANKIHIWEQCDSVSILRYLFDKINDLYPKGFNPLYGLCLHSQYKCGDCKVITHQRQFESIYCLFPNRDSKSIQEMLHEEFKKTEIEHKCEKCESKKCTRSVSLDSIPEYIFISLQHIGDDTDFKINSSIEINSIDYSLKGCIEHLGMSEHGGHYVSYFKNSSDEWSLFDDDKIVPIQNEQMEERLTQNRRHYCQITLVWYAL